jgi:nucleoside-diphosphate-sugar epimerase
MTGALLSFCAMAVVRPDVAGHHRWPAAHRLDVARLYRLALEKGVTDGVYHAVAEEGVPMRQVGDVLGRALNAPATSIKKEEAGTYFGPLAMFASRDMPASSAKTQAELGWKPAEIGLIVDIGKLGYFKV